MSGARHVSVGGAPEGFDARLILDEIARAGAPVLHVARDDKRMAAMADGAGLLRARHAGADLSRLGLPAL